MNLLSFSQKSSIKNSTKNKDFNISEKGYGMLVDGVDTFAVVHIMYIREANGMFIERNYYRNTSDSLKSVDIIRKSMLSDKDNELKELEKEINRYKNITELEKEEADDCGGKYDKLAKKYKRAKLGNKILGVVSGAAGVLLLIVLI